MAGAYLFARTYTIPNFDPTSIILDFGSHGNNDYTNPQWHGTQQDRINAVSNGYIYLRNATASGLVLGIQDISNQGCYLYCR
jgi:hypothetical protein